MKLEEIYTSGEYLEKHPTWHAEEASWKARHIVPMMKRHRLVHGTICEVGCGTGEVLRLLQENMSDTCTFWGYDISPQAFTIGKGKANERLHFKLADIRQEQDAFFDLILVLDVTVGKQICNSKPFPSRYLSQHLLARMTYRSLWI